MLIAARNKGNNKSQSFRSPEGVPDGSNGIHLGYRYPIYASCIWTGTKSGQSGTGPSRKPAASNRAATRKRLLKAIASLGATAALGPYASGEHHGVWGFEGGRRFTQAASAATFLGRQFQGSSS